MYESPGVSFLKELSDIQKIGQLIMPRIDFNNSDTVDRAEILVKDYSVCGFIIFNGELEQVRETTSFLQSISEFPLLFGIDAERGLGQMLKGATYFPFLMSQGAINDTESVKKQAKITAEEMLYAGLNLIFTPVIDVNSNPQNPIVNIRSFGDDPQIVSELGAIFINEIQKRGVLSCCKHFPGHGDTDMDSHSTLPVIKKTYDELNDLDLIPFIAAIENKVSAVMPAHISFPGIDKSGKPATMSEVILEDILRKKLGFNGLIISDSFKMDALNGFGSEVQNTIEAIRSGVNIILDPEEPISLIENLSSGLNEFEETVNSSLNKLFFHKRFVNASPVSEEKLDFEQNKKASDIVSQKSVCRLKGSSLKNNKVLLCVFDSGKDKRFEFLATYLKDQKINIVGKSTSPKKADISQDTSIIFIISTTVSAWTDKFNLSVETRNFINSFEDLENEKILLNFGSPYIASNFNFFDTVILTFDSNKSCQKSVADVLVGKLKPEGKLPVNL